MSTKLKATRAGHRGVLTKLLKRVEADSEELVQSYSMNELSSIRGMIQKKEKTIEELNDKILEEMTEGEIQEEIEEAHGYTYDIQMVLTKLTKIIQDTETAKSTINVSKSPLNPHATEFTFTDDTASQPKHILTSASAFSNTSMYHKLPKLNLPTFGGNVLDWQPFWDSFSAAVHENLSLNDVQKFNYLKSQLYGEANKCIAGLQITNTNYAQALHILKQRFGQTHKIVNAYMQSLINLPNPTPNISNLKDFYDSMENYIRGLEGIGETHETYGSLLVPIILNKLPSIVRENMVRAHGNDRWSLPSLRDAIQHEITIKEAGQSVNCDNLEPNFTPTSAFIASAKRNRNLTSKPCIFCNEVHAPSVCYKVKGIDDRKRIIKEKQLCYNCLGNHRVADCKSDKTCKNCGKRHHTSICSKRQVQSQSNTRNESRATRETESDPVTSMHSFTSSPRSHVLLKTAIGPVSADRKNFDAANILFDEGAQRSFITQDLADKLNLQPRTTEVLTISGFGESNKKVRNLQVATVYLQSLGSDLIPIDVLIVPQIAHSISTYSLNRTTYPHLRGLKLAHSTLDDGEFTVSILVGADYYWDIVEDRVIRGQGPTAVGSKLGYLLSGPAHMNSRGNTSPSSSILNIITPHRQEECELHKFWEIENYETEKDNTAKSALEEMTAYQDTNVTLKENKYIARFPWKPEHPELPSNEMIARRRTYNVVNRLAKEPEMLKLYGDIIRDQEKRGFIEKIESSDDHSNNRIHYIPHHPVRKESSTTPIRIVYDCSCRQNSESPSLNDCLSSAPPQLNDLTNILTRFRLGKYAITTDIEKAFLQIGLAEEDRDATRFFWLSDPTEPKSKLDIYRFKVILFGATCSPFILNATLLKHLYLNPSTTSKILQRDLYVDNVLTSVDTEDTAVIFFTDSRKLLKEGGFNLRTWKSNSIKLTDMATHENVLDTDEETKILGMRWNAKSDTLTFANQEYDPEDESQLQATKREILSQSSSIYDPLGLLGPVTIRAKLLIQNLWKDKYDWDEVLPSNLTKTWIDIRNDIQDVTTQTRVARHYFTDMSEEEQNLESTLHVFVDASQRAYGASTYICKGTHSTIVMAKNRVAPLKGITLPKLELMAAVIGTRIATQLIRNLEINRVIFWSDSQIVLHWISSTKQKGKFVQNRVSEIKESTQNYQWKYVPTESNPADLQTRGISAKQFQNSKLWMQGPSWITDSNSWPTWTPDFKNETLLLTAANEDETEGTDTDRSELLGISNIIDLSRFSSLQKLLHVTCYVLKFVKHCRNKKRYNLRSSRAQEGFTKVEIQQATRLWIIDVQNDRFSEERDQILNNTRTNKIPLLRQLRLYIDDENIVRCAGRIHNSQLEECTKFPILLPKKHRFTDLIIMDAHQKMLHSGPGQTITHIRQKYWIPSIRQCVNHILHGCIRCRKVNGKPYAKPDSPPLPKDRVTDMIPFSTTGIDFAGPLYVKENGQIAKMYVCLFTCACIRAIHLELVADMTLETFMLAFRRFVSRRGIPTSVYSDNAPTFISAHNEIPRKMNIYLKWKFIPRAAPWYGGWWERLVGLTKTTLKKVLGRSQVNAELLRTILTEIECIINDRPITYISSDIRDPQPLTPSHLLQGRRISSPEEEHSEDTENNSDINSIYDMKSSEANKALERKLTLIEHFSKRWRTEYLTGLREFHRVSGENDPHVKVGSVVQIMDITPRPMWKLGVIIDVITGNDGLVRAAKIRTSNGFITTRPIVKLVPLEI